MQITSSSPFLPDRNAEAMDFQNMPLFKRSAASSSRAPSSSSTQASATQDRFNDLTQYEFRFTPDDLVGSMKKRHIVEDMGNKNFPSFARRDVHESNGRTVYTIVIPLKNNTYLQSSKTFNSIESAIAHTPRNISSSVHLNIHDASTYFDYINDNITHRSKGFRFDAETVPRDMKTFHKSQETLQPVTFVRHEGSRSNKAKSVAPPTESANEVNAVTTATSAFPSYNATGKSTPSDAEETVFPMQTRFNDEDSDQQSLLRDYRNN